MISEWIYTEYLSIYTQTLGYFSTILILLATGVGISITKEYSNTSRQCFVTSLFLSSFVCCVIAGYKIFTVYDGLRTAVLLMSDKCKLLDNSRLVCDYNIQEQSGEFKFALFFLLAGLVLFILGHALKGTTYGTKKLI